MSLMVSRIGACLSLDWIIWLSWMDTVFKEYQKAFLRIGWGVSGFWLY